MNNGINLGRLLSGISKSLGIANQILPIFHDTKPLFDNFKNIYNLMSNNSSNNKKIESVKTTLPVNKKTTTTFKSDSPKFFI